MFDKYQCDVVLGQENADGDPEKNAPDGILYFRPKDAQSNAIYWDPKRITGSSGGLERLSSPGFVSLRYLVWFNFVKDAHRVRIGSIHLPAFYNTKPKHRREYDKQEPKAASWFSGDEVNILGGDLNGRIGAARTRNLTKAGRWSKPARSGPQGQTIDWVGANRKGHWYPIRTQMHTPKNADHKPVIVTFEWR